MDTTTAWMILVRWIIAGVVCIAAIIGGCTAHEDYRISKDIEHGANPTAAACAHTIITSEARCAIVAAK